MPKIEMYIYKSRDLAAVYVVAATQTRGEGRVGELSRVKIPIRLGFFEHSNSILKTSNSATRVNSSPVHKISTRTMLNSD